MNLTVPGAVSRFLRCESGVNHAERGGTPHLDSAEDVFAEGRGRWHGPHARTPKSLESCYAGHPCYATISLPCSLGHSTGVGIRIGVTAALP
jgi:hypothetical protein